MYSKGTLLNVKILKKLLVGRNLKMLNESNKNFQNIIEGKRIDRRESIRVCTNNYNNIVPIIIIIM